MIVMVGLSCHVGERTVMPGQKKTGVGAGEALPTHTTLSKFLNALHGHRLWGALRSKELALILRRMLAEKEEGFRTGQEKGQEV